MTELIESNIENEGFVLIRIDRFLFEYHDIQSSRVKLYYSNLYRKRRK